MISCKALSRRFGALAAVKSVSLEVRPGEVFGLLGANGSGKSTTIRMLTGLLPPSSGEAVVAGVDVIRDPLLVREKIGYVAQKASLYPNLRVSENAAFFAGLYGVSRSELRERIARLSPALGLDARDHETFARDLPAGVRQRVAILVALLHEPRVLFLDEPTAGVDIAHRRALFDLLRELAREGRSLFLTSHHLDEMERCDHLAFIHEGELLVAGAPFELAEALEGGRRFLVRSSLEPRAVAAELAAFSGEPVERGVAVLVRAADEDALRALVRALPSGELVLAPASLESVFAKAVRRGRA